MNIIPLLKVHEYFQGVSDETLQEVVRHARVTHHAAGSVVHEADTVLTTVGFVLRGRLKAVRVGTGGTESLFRMIERGEQFGMMVGALAEPVPIRVVALEPTTVLRLDYEQAMELTFARPDLRRLWLTTFAGSLRKLFFGAAPKRAPMMLALIHDSPATRRAAERLIQRLRDIGEQLAVFSDSDQWRGSPDVRFRPLRADGRELDGDGNPPAGSRVAGRQPHHLRRPRGPDAGAGSPADGTRRSRGLLRPRQARQTPRSAACRRSTCRPAAGATRSASPGCWRAAAPWSPSCRTSRDFACRDFKIAETPPQLPWGQVAGQRAGTAGPRPPRRAHRRGPRRRGRPRHVPPRRAQGPRAERHRRGHDRRHQRRRHDRHYVLRRPGPRLQRQSVRDGPSPLVDLSPPAAGQPLVPPVQVPPRAVRPDASQIPSRLEARTTRLPLPFRHRRSGGRQLRSSRTRRRRPRDSREH